ncbi:B12-binding domain-containing radical SAM protein [Curvivirga sp.]|uniref:B12-binding domain-containing radical SAM protein n=1 Tax=Curvivirga sp. TaxID=2856848 RepID=UPI003B5A7D5E
MRIALIIPQTNYPAPPPNLDMLPQGPAYIAGALKAAGHSVFGVTTNYDMSGRPAYVVLEEAIKNAINTYQPELIAVGAMAAEYLFLRDAIQLSRQHASHVPIVCGGSIMTNDRVAFEMLRPDFAIMDEGEDPILDLVSALETHQAVHDIDNLAYWKDGRAIYNKLRPAVKKLDDLALPDYDVLDINTYFEMSNQTDQYFKVLKETRPRMLPISSGRSCPYKCTFCQYSTVEGSRRKYRGRTMRSVVDEVTHFHDKYDINILKIYDDLFSVKEDRIREFCDLMRETKLGIHWNASMRVCDVTPDLLRDMKDAGCVYIGYGFESADDNVLDSMQKKVTVKEIQHAIEITEQAGVGVQGNFIFGDPAETQSSIENTIDFYEKHCKDHIIHCDYVTPYPGSPIFDHTVRKGLIGDRSNYYETIHTRPQYNMTKMKDEDIFSAVDQHVQTQLYGLKHLKNLKFGIADKAGFTHPYFDNKTLHQVQGECPHCGETCEYILPRVMPSEENWADQLKLLEPTRQICSHCSKRVLVSFVSFSVFADAFEKYIQKVNEIAETDQTVFVAPVLAFSTIDCIAALGMNFFDLNINALLQNRPALRGMKMFDWPIKHFNQEIFYTFPKAKVVIMPHRDTEKIYEELKEWGVSDERIYAPLNGCLDTN